MPTYIRILTTSDGQLHPVDYGAANLTEAAAHEPHNGVYTVLNTFNTYQTLKLTAHLDRLEDSARRADIALVLDRALLRRALRQMIEDAGFGDVRLRITVPHDTPQNFILTLEPYHPPAVAIITAGVRVMTAPDSARTNPAAKTTDWMHQRKALADARPEGIYDVILTDAAGNLLECLGANFYAIRDGHLYTAVEGVLRGISQQIVLDVAPDILPVEPQPLNLRDLPRIDEAFLTSSSRAVIPIVAIDDQVLGDGKPGSLTLRIRSAYLDWMDKNLEDL